jgi:hypothetical protein
MQQHKQINGHRSGQLTPTVESRGPHVTPFKQSNLNEAVSSKLVHGSNEASTIDLASGKETRQSPEYLGAAATRTANSIVDSHNIQQNLPDIELIKQIVIPSIISPNDMMNEQLTYNTTDEELGSVSTACLEIVEDACRNFYKVDKNMSRELEDILYNVGSYIETILPEASIDTMVNSSSRISTEDLNGLFDTKGNLSHLGLLGNPTYGPTDPNSVSDRDGFRFTVGMESHGNTANGYNPAVAHDPFRLRVTDNINVLKMPKLKEKAQQDRLGDIYKNAGIGAESYLTRLNQLSNDKNDNDTGQSQQAQAAIRETIGSLYTDRHYNMREVVSVPTRSKNKRDTIGRPLVMRLPSESVIPVHTPSDVSEHIGYYVLLDQTGNPIRVTMNDSLFENMRFNYQNSGAEMSSYLASQVNQMQQGQNINGNGDQQMQYEEAVRVYTELVERDLIDRLKNGVYGEELGLSRITEIYRIMFARAMQKQHTQLLFIPKTLVTYLAFDFNEFGMGISLIEKTKMLSSLRISLLYANAMAVVRNSITQRRLQVELDEMDVAPELTISTAQHRAAIAMNRANPFGGFDPNNILERLTQASVSTEVTGGAGNFPQTKVGMEYSNSNYTQVDTTFTDDIKDQHHMGLWVTPEMLDTATGTDFATSIVANNALFAKRTKNTQLQYCELKTMHIRKLCYNDNIILTKLIDAIKSNRASIPENIANEYSDEEIAMYFINTIEVSLPEPDMSKFEMQMEAFTAYSDALDKILPTFINQDILTQDLIGELSNVVGPTIATVKNYFLRRYLKENNILPELFDLVTKDEDSEPALKLLEEQNIHISSIQASILEFMKARITQTKITNDQLQKSQGEDGEGLQGGGADYSTNNDNPDDTTMDDTQTDEFDFEMPDEPSTDDTSTDTTADPATETVEDNPDEEDPNKTE